MYELCYVVNTIQYEKKSMMPVIVVRQNANDLKGRYKHECMA